MKRTISPLAVRLKNKYITFWALSLNKINTSSFYFQKYPKIWSKKSNKSIILQNICDKTAEALRIYQRLNKSDCPTKYLTYLINNSNTIKSTIIENWGILRLIRKMKTIKKEKLVQSNATKTSNNGNMNDFIKSIGYLIK